MQPVYVYTLSEGDDVRYVGVTRLLEDRKRQHLFKRDGTIKAKWVGSLAQRGKLPDFDVIDTVDESDWQFWESFWIQQFRGWGYRLVNADNGGLGRVRNTPELAAKIAQTLKGRPQPVHWRPVHAYSLDGRYVRTFASFAYAAMFCNGSHGNISRSVRLGLKAYGYLWSCEYRDAISSPYINGRLPSRPMPDHVKEMLVAISRGKVVSAETRLKQRNAKLKRGRGSS